MRRLVPTTAIALAIAAALALPATARDAQETHQLVEQQDFMPLTDLLNIIQRSHPGTVLEAELEEEDDATSGWVYEVEVLTSPDQISEIEIDAVNGQIVEVGKED